MRWPCRWRAGPGGPARRSCPTRRCQGRDPSPPGLFDREPGFLRRGVVVEVDCRMSVSCYLTSVRTTISTKGQIVLPAELRAADGIEAGEQFEVDRVGPDEYRLTRLTAPPHPRVVVGRCFGS